jgi:flagellar basal-body rod modification protein FlgD
MAVDSVDVSSSIGLDGNSYTTSISNDKLTNEDFLKLLLTEMQMQDPTEPMDSDRMLQDQLQMSSIDSNMATVDAMNSLKNSFAQTALANAASVINHVVEDGEIGETGVPNQYLVSSVESQDGSIILQANVITGYDEENQNYILSVDKKPIDFNNVTKIF